MKNVDALRALADIDRETARHFNEIAALSRSTAAQRRDAADATAKATASDAEATNAEYAENENQF